MPTPPFHYVEHPPGAGLRRWVACYWGFMARAGPDTPGVHYVPPDGCTSLAVICPPGAAPIVMLSGPWLNVFTVPVQPGVRHWGVRLLPHTGGRFAGADPSRLRDRTQPARPLLGPLADRIGETLAGVTDVAQAAERFDRLLLPHVETLAEPDGLATAAVERIVASAGEEGIGRLAAELGSSPRTLLRRFRAATGLTPKQFARIERLRQAAVRLLARGRPAWAQLAVLAGYADQAHLVREFTELTGLSPEAFLARVRATAHENLEW